MKNVLLALCLLASAQVGQLHAQNVKTIDKRTMTNASGSVYFLVFVGLPYAGAGGHNAGHAFVIWGAEDAQKQMSYSSAFGLYPDKQSVKLLFKEVPGSIKDEAMSKNSKMNRLIVKVDKSVYDAALAKKNQWAAKGTYQLLTRDCLSFTIDVATIAKLKIPSRTGFDNIPWNYINSLITAN